MGSDDVYFSKFKILWLYNIMAESGKYILKMSFTNIERLLSTYSLDIFLCR